MPPISIVRYRILKGPLTWRVEGLLPNGKIVKIRYCENWKEAVALISAWGAW